MWDLRVLCVSTVVSMHVGCVRVRLCVYCVQM